MGLSLLSSGLFLVGVGERGREMFIKKGALPATAEERMGRWGGRV